MAQLQPRARADDDGPAGGLRYTVMLPQSDIPALDTALAQAATLVSLRTDGAIAASALIARARADQARFTAALRSLGYYNGHCAIAIAGHDLDDPRLGR